LEWLAFRAGQVPLPALDLLLGPLQARVLMAAERCGVFTALAGTESRAGDLASALRVDEECLRLVLRVLEAMGYVSRRGDRWRLSTRGRRYFGPAATEPHQAFLEYGPPQWRFIERLEEVLRSGRGIDFHDHQTPEEWQAYQRSMFEGALSVARFVAKRTPVPAGAALCLDLGGSHGYIGALLAQRHPPMRSIVLERREALSAARGLGAGQPWHRLVSFMEGDALRDDFGRAKFDVVLMSNVLHHFSAAANRGILERVRTALKPRGTAAIFEIEAPAANAAPDAAGDGLALYFRITSTSACFGAAEYVQWLSETGFHHSRVLRTVTLPGRMLVVAER
jgi:SAM-dependent methyltransferase